MLNGKLRQTETLFHLDYSIMASGMLGVDGKLGLGSLERVMNLEQRSGLLEQQKRDVA
jgi:hypothetical protein